jgi:diguanylate cyclase (GGDEF)-like protein
MRLDLPLAQRDRLLVVHDPAGITDLLRERYPQFDIATSPTYLAGISSLADRSTRGLLVGVDPTARKLDQALAALRKAAGREARIVLCCHPSGEPQARRVLDAGADDYLICPPTGPELDRALGLGSAYFADGTRDEGAPLPTWEEITSLAGALAGLEEGRRPMLERICRMLGESLRTSNVNIIIKHESVHIGNPSVEPAISEEIVAEGKLIGRILVGPRQRDPFTVAEVEKIRHYARLLTHLLEAADQQQEWMTLAFMDEVSQLPNRRYLVRTLPKLLNRAANERFSVTVLIFDIDGFKHFNDTYGHAAGDQVIRETGQLFRSCSRQHDIVVRYAGDEFVVVFWDAEEPRMRGSKHPSNALLVLHRFKKALESHEFKKLGSETRGCLTISGGLATFPWDGQTMDELLEQADQALLEAKRAGKNRIYLVGDEHHNADQANHAS